MHRIRRIAPTNPTLRAAAIIACAGVFALAAAQFPWETSTVPGYGSDSQAASTPTSTSDSGNETPFGSSDAAEASFESYDIGPYSSSKKNGSGASTESASNDAKAKKKSSDKPPKEKKLKTSLSKSLSLSFSSAFSGPQKTCPVCASVRLKSNQYVECDAGRIHVCSAACIDRVRRNPTAFAGILVQRGEQLTTP